MLNEEYNAILETKLPPNLKDPRKFTIPCTVGEFKFDEVFYDLGASINFMPLSIFKKRNLEEVKATLISLQLAKYSIKYSRRIIKDILMKVDKFILLFFLFCIW